MPRGSQRQCRTLRTLGGAGWSVQRCSVLSVQRELREVSVVSGRLDTWTPDRRSEPPWPFLGSQRIRLRSRSEPSRSSAVVAFETATISVRSPKAGDPHRPGDHRGGRGATRQLRTPAHGAELNRIGMVQPPPPDSAHRAADACRGQALLAAKPMAVLAAAARSGRIVHRGRSPCRTLDGADERRFPYDACGPAAALRHRPARGLHTRPDAHDWAAADMCTTLSRLVLTASRSAQTSWSGGGAIPWCPDRHTTLDPSILPRRAHETRASRYA
ncbi:hypothetical protein FHU33_1772 [Blastococcus colisei]|uniref:Uncharacterized protein n=1 Tax=Blastococcus colisei TaxID=1564162 RepID=A0A543PE68_9ACTN|nr:hypothetical protein FHU33_1772 [Blastococcus colisei]